MAARKAGSKKKAGAKKASAKKGGASKKGARKAGAKKTAAKKTAAKKTAAKQAANKKAAAKKPPAAKSGASSSDVTMGHVFGLRPRVVTSFRPDDFRRARQVLADESYANISEAARAVVDKALEFTREQSTGISRPKRM